MVTKRLIAWTTLSIVVVATFGGCPRSQPLDPVSVRMKWIINGTTSEFFLGNENGIFKSNGFLVEIQPGGPGISGVQLVASGTSTFAVTSAEEVIRAQANNIDVVAIASIFQENPVRFLSSDKSAVTGPSDLKGKKIALVLGDNTELQFKSLLGTAGLTLDKVKVLPWTFDLRLFVAGDIDVIPAYAFDQPLQIKRLAPEFAFSEINPERFGVVGTGDVLITSGALHRSQSGLVKRFVKAFLASLDAARRNQPAAVRSLLKANRDLVYQDEFETWQRACDFISADGQAPGRLINSRWEATLGRLRQHEDGLKFPPTFTLYQCFTNDHVDQIIAGK